MSIDHQSPAELVYAFYKARQANDPDALRVWLADDVRWNEPVVGDHMGQLRGADAVVDMLKGALATTGGTFTLRVASTVETGNHCAAVVDWSADKNNRTIRGQELAVFSFKGARIVEASFYASDIGNDQAFWED
ncbi:nuclear transport factor 2 family protein [Altererythrobacter sp. MTPC7]|uniref:nuclear transport factor 2 family protein n=1 Tax=Altererythrobacter sp. MTPC7 TaxID=3056567 RepID=UPI0036F3A59E